MKTNWKLGNSRTNILGLRLQGQILWRFYNHLAALLFPCKSSKDPKRFLHFLGKIPALATHFQLWRCYRTTLLKILLVVSRFLLLKRLPFSAQDSFILQLLAALKIESFSNCAIAILILQFYLVFFCFIIKTFFWRNYMFGILSILILEAILQKFYSSTPLESV